MIAILTAAFFAFAGLLAAGVLTYQHYDLAVMQRMCTGGGCLDVLTSRYSTLGPVPISLVGAVYYGAMVAVALLAIGISEGPFRRGLTRWGLRFSILGAIASSILLLIQLLVIRAFCPLCVLSGIVTFFIAGALVAARRRPWAAERRAAALIALGMGTVAGLVTAAVAGSRGDGELILARVDDQVLTAGQMQREPLPMLNDLQDRLYQLRLDWTNRRIDQILIDAEARRRGVTSDDLIRQEVDGRIAAEAKSLTEWLAARKAPDDDESWNATRQAALDELRQHRLAEWTASLRAGHDIRILLPAPPGRVITFDWSLGHQRGAEDATIRLAVFSDFQCSYCADMASSIRQAIDTFPFEVSVTFFPLPLKEHPQARAAAEASECAAEQSRFWLYHDALMKRRGELDGNWEQLAAEAGLDMDRFRTCMKSGDASAAVQANLKQAASLAIDSAPTVFLNGRRIGGLLSAEELIDVIRLERKSLARGTR